MRSKSFLVGVSRPGSTCGRRAGAEGEAIGCGRKVPGGGKCAPGRGETGGVPAGDACGCGGGGAAGGCGGSAQATLGGAGRSLACASGLWVSLSDASSWRAGTWTTVLHCGQEARRPAADAGTFRVRPQPVQWNSMESAVVVGVDIDRIQLTTDNGPLPAVSCQRPFGS